MSHEKLKWMKDSLICVVENELCNLGEVDTKELGEAIDMIKDLEEAIYYATVTEAMNKPGKEWEMKKSDHHQSPEDDRMYYGYPMYADSGRQNSERHGRFQRRHIRFHHALESRKVHHNCAECGSGHTVRSGAYAHSFGVPHRRSACPPAC